MIVIIYSIIIFIACTLGAIVGMGGGVIIKPLLDFIGYNSVEVVSFISTCAVFSMSISSSIKHIKAKTKINPKIALLLSFGSVFGGIIGNEIFDLVLNHFNENIVKGVQAVMLTAFIIFALIYVNSKRAKSLHTTNQIAIILIGLFLGFSSAFLGIGGGPINTIFLVLFLSFTFKESVVYSVAIIFFSQLSHLIAIFVNNQFEPYKDYLPIILIAMVVSVLGGIIGSKLNKKLSNKSITKIFTAVMLLVAVINICNAITGLVIN